MSQLIVFLILCLTEPDISGEYPPGFVLFVSETNNMNVRFNSDYADRERGFTLDVSSVACGE